MTSGMPCGASAARYSMHSAAAARTKARGSSRTDDAPRYRDDKTRLAAAVTPNGTPNGTDNGPADSAAADAALGVAAATGMMGAGLALPLPLPVPLPLPLPPSSAISKKMSSLAPPATPAQCGDAWCARRCEGESSGRRTSVSETRPAGVCSGCPGSRSSHATPLGMWL